MLGDSKPELAAGGAELVEGLPPRHEALCSIPRTPLTGGGVHTGSPTTQEVEAGADAPPPLCGEFEASLAS